jgi:hypothetical protein
LKPILDYVEFTLVDKTNAISVVLLNPRQKKYFLKYKPKIKIGSNQMSTRPIANI